jgi:hypothetical protein
MTNEGITNLLIQRELAKSTASIETSARGIIGAIAASGDTSENGKFVTGVAEIVLLAVRYGWHNELPDLTDAMSDAAQLWVAQRKGVL